jgi:hypothetical protein
LFFLLWQKSGGFMLFVPHQSAFVPCPCTLQISLGSSETAPQLAHMNAFVSFGRGTCFSESMKRIPFEYLVK